MNAYEIARVAHQADRTLSTALGHPCETPWLVLTPECRANLVLGVEVALDTPRASAEDLHAAWLQDKLDAGWTWGPRFDAGAKTDPVMLPWAQLSGHLQRREVLFLAVVRSLSQNP